MSWEVAAEMTFTGRPIKADEALARGLCMKVVEPEALMDEARRWRTQSRRSRRGLSARPSA